MVWHALELVRGGKQHWHDACGAPAHLRLEAVAHRVLVEQQQAEELQPGNGRRSGTLATFGRQERAPLQPQSWVLPWLTPRPQPLAPYSTKAEAEGG